MCVARKEAGEAEDSHSKGMPIKQGVGVEALNKFIKFEVNQKPCHRACRISLGANAAISRKTDSGHRKVFLK
jgi:hypothetical protein